MLITLFSLLTGFLCKPINVYIYIYIAVTSFYVRMSSISFCIRFLSDTDLYSPSFPISPASSDGLKVNNVVKRHDVSTGALMTVDEKVTRYLKNTAEVKVRNKSTSHSRRRKHSSHSAKKHRLAKESPSSSSYIKETASNPLVVKLFKNLVLLNLTVHNIHILF